MSPHRLFPIFLLFLLCAHATAEEPIPKLVGHVSAQAAMSSRALSGAWAAGSERVLVSTSHVVEDTSTLEVEVFTMSADGQSLASLGRVHDPHPHSDGNHPAVADGVWGQSVVVDDVTWAVDFNATGAVLSQPHFHESALVVGSTARTVMLDVRADEGQQAELLNVVWVDQNSRPKRASELVYRPQIHAVDSNAENNRLHLTSVSERRMYFGGYLHTIEVPAVSGSTIGYPHNVDPPRVPFPSATTVRCNVMGTACARVLPSQLGVMLRVSNGRGTLATTSDGLWSLPNPLTGAAPDPLFDVFLLDHPDRALAVTTTGRVLSFTWSGTTLSEFAPPHTLDVDGADAEVAFAALVPQHSLVLVGTVSGHVWSVAMAPCGTLRHSPSAYVLAKVSLAPQSIAVLSLPDAMVFASSADGEHVVGVDVEPLLAPSAYRHPTVPTGGGGVMPTPTVSPMPTPVPSKAPPCEEGDVDDDGDGATRSLCTCEANMDLGGQMALQALTMVGVWVSLVASAAHWWARTHKTQRWDRVAEADGEGGGLEMRG